eukprot:scaffold36_cov127-Cylindrotheca_fusiformis.AAC.4
MMRACQIATFILCCASSMRLSNEFQRVGFGPSHRLLQGERLSTKSVATRGTSRMRMLIANEPTANIKGLLQNPDVWVFLIGAFPFAWATVEFWRRIAFGEPFGTGSDSVIIGTDDDPLDSRGRLVLGSGALAVAYFLFAASFATLAVVLYAFVSSSPMPEVLPSIAGEDSINGMFGN